MITFKNFASSLILLQVLKSTNSRLKKEVKQLALTSLGRKQIYIRWEGSVNLLKVMEITYVMLLLSLQDHEGD